MRDIVAELGQSRPMQPDAAPEAPAHDPSELLGVISADRKEPYDMREVLLRMIDAGEPGVLPALSRPEEALRR